MKTRFLVPIAALLVILSISLVAAQTDDCPELVKRAITAVAKVCDTLGRNEACYGNDRLQAELDNNAPFTQPADRVSVGDIRSLRTFGLDEQAGTWGIAVLNIQANLPDTLPGQAVKFILYGDVALQNASGSGTPELGPMQAFYFTTNAIKPNCKEAPASSLVIQSPKGYRVSLTANGLDLDIGSSVVFTAQRGQRMTVSTLQGKVFATYNGKKQVIPQGFETSVELGGEDGFTPQDAPDTAYLIDDSEWQPLADATDGLVEDPIKLPDTSQWSAPEDYCADPANADVCADPNFKQELSFAECPPDICPPPDENAPAVDPNATPCPDVFCDPLPPPDSCTDCSTPIDSNDVCGNAVCDVGENADSCSQDCPVEIAPSAPVCGDSVCDANEDSNSCPADCGQPVDQPPDQPVVDEPPVDQPPDDQSPPADQPPDQPPDDGSGG